MKPDKGNNKKNTFGLISLILWALMLTLLFRSCTSSYANSNQVQVDYSVFRQWVVAELVEEVHMESDHYVITLKEGSRSLEKFKAALEANGSRPGPKWIDFDKNNLVATVTALPVREDVDLPIEEHLIVELYSK